MLDRAQFVLIAAAVLGLGLLVIIWVKYTRTHQKRLRINIRWGFPSSTSLDQLAVMIEVTNSSTQLAMLHSVHLEWAYGVVHPTSAIDGFEALPLSMAQDRTATFWMPVQVIKGWLTSTHAPRYVRINAIATDATGTVSRSNRLRLDLQSQQIMPN